MDPSSRTPEGEPRRCHVCGHLNKIEPSGDTGDAPCPCCGYLLWFGSHGSPNRSERIIEETKQKIRGMVSEIAAFAKSDLPDEEFYQKFLPRVVSCMAADAGAIWMKESTGQLALKDHVDIQQTGLREDEEAQFQHGRLLQEVLALGETLLVQPKSGLDDEAHAINPTDFLLVLGPLRSEEEVVGVVEIFQHANAGPITQKGYSRFVQQMCDIARR